MLFKHRNKRKWKQTQVNAPWLRGKLVTLHSRALKIKQKHIAFINLSNYCDLYAETSKLSHTARRHTPWSWVEKMWSCRINLLPKNPFILNSFDVTALMPKLVNQAQSRLKTSDCRQLSFRLLRSHSFRLRDTASLNKVTKMTYVHTFSWEFTSFYLQARSCRSRNYWQEVGCMPFFRRRQAAVHFSARVLFYLPFSSDTYRVADKISMSKKVI